MGTLLQDLRYGARMLARNPGFTAVAVLTLALGIGANTAIFSLVDAFLLRPLPYTDSDRLAFLSEHSEQVPNMSVAYLNYLDWVQQNQSFDRLAALQPDSLNLTDGDRPERVLGWNVSANFLQTLGVKPQLGRDFGPDDDRPGATPAVILGYGLWQQRYGADPAVVGTVIAINGTRHTVVGILPPSFRFFISADALVPLGLQADQMKDRDSHPGIYVVGRLKPGVTLARARADMSTVAKRLGQAYPNTNAHNGVVVTSLREELFGQLRPALLVLLAAVGFVLLIACANVANLMLARTATREREIAIRAALGATRLRVARQLLTESLLLAVLGGGGGLLLAFWGVDALRGFVPTQIRELASVGVDTRVLVFTALVVLLTGILFGIAPALQAARADVNESLKEGGRTATTGRHRLRQLLTAAEVALALVLLVGAGLSLESFRHLLQVSPGFQIDNLLTARISLPDVKYATDEQRTAFFSQVLARLRAPPGVRAAAAVLPLPLTGNGWQTDFTVEGKPLPPGELPNSDYHRVTPSYFATMGIPLLKGRAFSPSDDSQAPQVAVVSESFAQRYWHDEDAVGKRFHTGRSEEKMPWMTVIGVVGNTKQYGLDQPTKTEFYIPYAQHPTTSMTLVILADSHPEALAGSIRQVVQSIDPEQPIYRVQTLRQFLDQTLLSWRLTMLLLGAFAGLAIVLAAVGIYGVISYSVSQRTHEIGVRMALGAERHQVLKMVVRQAMTLVLVGVVVGLGAALALGHLLSAVLFGVKPTDPFTLGAVTALLVLVSLVACYLPARRAARVDPLVALRYE